MRRFRHSMRNNHITPLTFRGMYGNMLMPRELSNLEGGKSHD